MKLAMFLAVILFSVPGLTQTQETVNPTPVYNLVCDGEVGDFGVEFEAITNEVGSLELTKVAAKAVLMRKKNLVYGYELKPTQGLITIVDAGVQASKSDLSYLWNNYYKVGLDVRQFNLKASIKTTYLNENMTVSCRVDALKNLSTKQTVKY